MHPLKIANRTRAKFHILPKAPNSKIWVLKKLTVQTISFDDLPAEIRDEIYHLHLVSPRPRVLRWDGEYQTYSVSVYKMKESGFPTGLLLASKSIYSEAAPILYSNNCLHYAENSINRFFDPIPSLSSRVLAPRTTIKWLRQNRIGHFKNMTTDYQSAAVDLRCITMPIVNATKAAIRDGHKMALEMLEVRRLRWKMSNILPGLHAMLRQLRKLKPEKSLSESGVPDIVHFVAYDGLDAPDKTTANAAKYTLKIRSKLKALMEAEEARDS